MDINKIKQDLINYDNRVNRLMRYANRGNTPLLKQLRAFALAIFLGQKN